MQKALFFMAVLRCTAGEDYATHKGTYALDFGGKDGGKDLVFAPFDLKVKKIDKAANTVFFESLEKVETPTFTDYVCGRFAHCNDADMLPNCYTGAVIKQGEAFYREGGRGSWIDGKFASHVHAVFARGHLTGAYWYDVGNGNYSMLSTGGKQHIYDVLFVPDDVQIVKTNDYKDSYPWRRTSRKEDEKVEIKEGKQTVRHNGKTYTVVKQAENEDVAIWSLKHPALAKLSTFRSNGEKPNFAKNLSYFVMDGKDRGQVGGSEISDIYDEAVPTEQKYIDVVKLKDGTWKFGNFGPYQYRSDEVELRYSTGMVLVAGGAYSNEYSIPDGAGIRTKKTILSCLFVDWSNVAYMVVSKESVTPDEMRDFAMSLNMQYAFRDDSGGSAEIVEKGIVIAGARDEERALPNCLVFVPKKEIKPEPEDPAIPEDQTMIFKCIKASTSEGYPLRSSAPSGAVVDYLQPGEKVKVVDIQNKGKNQYTSAAEPWCLTDYGLWFAYDKNYFE